MVTLVHNGGRLVDQDSGPGASTVIAQVGGKNRVLQCVDPRSASKRHRMQKSDNTTVPTDVDTTRQTIEVDPMRLDD